MPSLSRSHGVPTPAHSRRWCLDVTTRVPRPGSVLPSWSTIVSGRLELRDLQRGFTCVHPSRLSLAWRERMARSRLGRYPWLRTPPLPVTHAGIGNRPGTLAWGSLSSLPTQTVRPRVAQSVLPVDAGRAPRRPPGGRRGPRRTAGRSPAPSRHGAARRPSPCRENSGREGPVLVERPRARRAAAGTGYHQGMPAWATRAVSSGTWPTGSG